MQVLYFLFSFPEVCFHMVFCLVISPSFGGFNIGNIVSVGIKCQFLLIFTKTLRGC